MGKYSFSILVAFELLCGQPFLNLFLWRLWTGFGLARRIKPDQLDHSVFLSSFVEANKPSVIVVFETSGMILFYTGSLGFALGAF